MKKQNGVTLVFLVMTVVIFMIISTIIIFNSVNLYIKMEYENYIVKLEELQAAVDKMCEKYKTDGYTSYIDNTDGFFIKKFGKIPGTLAIAENKEKSEVIIEKYFSGNSDFHNGFVFYFSADEIEEYFNINGINFDVIVDFSTRYVYSIEGGIDYGNDKEMVYSLIDINSSSILQESAANTASNASGITFTQQNLQSGDTKMCKITLVLNYEGEGSKYDIKKAYYSMQSGDKWVEVDYLGDCEYTDSSVSFYVYNSGTYYFKIEDTSGKMTSNIQGATDSVYTTINF